MIEVPIRREQDPDVLDVEPELRDVVDDLVGAVLIAAVDQDVSVRSGEEERRDVWCADEVETPGDVMRIGAGVPIFFHRFAPDGIDDEGDKDGECDQRGGARSP